MNAERGEMRIAAAVGHGTDAAQATGDLVAPLRGALGGASVDLCLLFASAHYEEALDRLAPDIHEQLAARVLVGMTAETVIAGEHEFENQPAVSLWAAHLPGVRVVSFHLSVEDVQRLTTPAKLREYLGIPADEAPSFVLLADPFTFNPTPFLAAFLERLGEAYPGRPVLGGLASAGEAPGQNRLVFDGLTLRHGLVGVALFGNVRLDAVVSQGCRPIGRPLVVTRAEGNVVRELGGRPPLAVVRRMVTGLTARDRELLERRGLLLGCAINEYQKEFAQGDFLIRNPIGFDPTSGAMGLNDLIRTGQTVQFHVRDAESATQELETLLASAGRRPAAGALLFTCNGRGTRLFGQRHHDARAIRDASGAVPLAGCFCAGEIGPVGQRNFLHGHTASVGFVRPADATHV